MTLIKLAFQTMLPIAIVGFFPGGLIAAAPVFAQPNDAVVGSFVGRLKAGDRIRLTVTGFPDLSGEQIIMADGTLNLPLAGAISIAGRTPNEAVQTITASLRPYIRRPQVGLAVVTLRPPRISVTGEVLRPGPRLMVPLQQQWNANSSQNTGGENFQTVSYALLLAGGVTPNADIRNITIRRANPAAATKSQTDGPKTEIKVDLWQAIQTGNLDSDLQVVDGDEIVIPTAKVSRVDQQQLLASTISPGSITVQVAGQVQRPGTVQIDPRAGVSAAVAAAGGFTEKASHKVALIRMSPEGKLERKTFAFGEDSGPLREGDVIVVSKSALKSIIDTLGNVISPITPFLFLIR